MKNKKLIGLMWALALLPAVLAALCWSRLPQQVPIRWNLDGSVSYGGRMWLWLLAAIPVVFALLFQFMPRLDPKRKNYEKFQGLYDFLGPVFSLVFLVLMAITLTESLRPGTVQVGRVVCALVSALLIVLGSLMGKLKPSWFIGFRTPWALSDPDVWNKTQRMGGWMFFLTGLITLILALLTPEKVFFTVFFVLLLGGLVLTTFMSWKWYREKAAS